MSLCIDNLKEIIYYLDRKDLYYLSLTSKFYNELIQFKQLIINTIHNRLKLILNEHYEEFMNKMIDNGAFISGSFIIQCILNEYWSHSGTDLDIYVPSINNNVREHTFDEDDEDDNEDKKIYYYNEVEDFVFNIGYHIKSGPGPNKMYTINKFDKDLPYITNVRTYSQENNLDIQVISLNINKDLNHYHDFLNGFDFDICKNLYCPTNNTLIINNIDNILNKTTTFNATSMLKLSIARYHNYITRGFDFINKSIITYNDIKHTDVCEMQVDTRNDQIPDTIKNFINVNHGYIRPCLRLYQEKCIKNQCVICFIDPYIKHKHYMNDQIRTTHHLVRLL